MTEYRVTYSINIDADSPLAAARETFKIMTDQESMLPVLTVSGPDWLGNVDLAEEADLSVIDKYDGPAS